MKKVFYLSSIAILISTNVFSAPLHNYAEINTTSVGLDTRGYNMVGAGYMYQW